MNKNIISVIILLAIPYLLFSQRGKTANDHVPKYEGDAFFGTNMGYFPNWSDEQLADIGRGNGEIYLSGAALETIRPALFGHFLEQWGYDIRVKTFEHYEKLGYKDITCFIGNPSEAQRDQTVYCPGQDKSRHFANLYEPIWDNGENGTPVNDENYFALFVYKTLSKYKDHVKIWEIWNEPDLGDRDFKGHSDALPGQEGNWWENNPDPCEYKMRAPIFHYIRTLRIGYEVIKKIDPDAFVAIGGLGHPSFLDAVLRNTDNPDDGKVDAKKYPLGGGAYFDVMSFHSYPHIDGSLRKWSNKIGGFEYYRHSDKAVQGVMDLRNEFRDVLHSYGYTGNQYPKKEWIITETNIPRHEVRDFIGSNIAQRNFLMKLSMVCKKEKIHQLHIYNLAEGTSIHPTADDEFAAMGIYETLNGIKPYEQKFTEGGAAFLTMVKMLENRTYSPERSLAMKCPKGVQGYAFKDIDDEYIYALWAETKMDKNEYPKAMYSFPESWGYGSFVCREWTYGLDSKSYPFDQKNIELTGSPIFFTPKKDGKKSIHRISNETLNVGESPLKDVIDISFQIKLPTSVIIDLINKEGEQIKLIQGKKSYNTTGVYDLQLNTSELKQGVYFVRMISDKGIFSKKIVKN